jgi:hypothetical protein
LLMSIGAAVFTLRVAAARFGLSCLVEYNHTGARPPWRCASRPRTSPGRADDLFRDRPATTAAHFPASRVPRWRRSRDLTRTGRARSPFRQTQA